jgi:hypothetical protein
MEVLKAILKNVAFLYASFTLSVLVGSCAIRFYNCKGFAGILNPAKRYLRKILNIGVPFL